MAPCRRVTSIAPSSTCLSTHHPGGEPAAAGRPRGQGCTVIYREPVRDHDYAVWRGHSPRAARPRPGTERRPYRRLAHVSTLNRPSRVGVVNSLYPRPAPDSETHSRASATMTDCGPAPATPATSIVVP